MEKKHEMMSLEDSEQLKGRMKFFEKELVENHHIDPNLYVEYDVKRGLRDSAGKGVLTGLTEISDVTGYKLVNGRRIPADGALYYRGIDVQDIVNGLKDRRFGFEETIYLLIFGKLPSKEELSRFLELLSDMEDLGGRFVRDVVMKGTNANIMNAMERCVLALYTYDDNPEDISVENVLRQSLELIAKLPEIAVYSYHAYRHFRKDETLFIRNPQKGLSLAENILLMLRPDGNYTELEAKVLDIALVLHAEHGGGNNSTFTTHVVTSSGTDSYSSTSASIGSLKGPRHGGANLKVQNMFTDLKANVKDWESDEEITAYLQKILNKEAFDHAGLIYGMGHAVYTLSDPREVILKRFAQALAEEKGMIDEFKLYDKVEGIAGKLVMEHRKLFKNVCANVDFYSGFVYSMLGIPEELFTPIFAIARMPGWSAHRLDEQIRQSIVMMEPKWSEKEIEFDVDMMDVEYLGNENLICHVWDNLLSNAIKFSPCGGTIYIRMMPEGEKIRFSIENEGPQISEYSMKHIFDKFYQGDSSHKQEGNGLGLALVKQILNLCKGTVSVENIPGSGCRFTVIL